MKARIATISLVVILTQCSLVSSTLGLKKKENDPTMILLLLVRLAAAATPCPVQGFVSPYASVSLPFDYQPQTETSETGIFGTPAGSIHAGFSVTPTGDYRVAGDMLFRTKFQRYSGFTFVVRTSEANYIRFQDNDTGCNSFVGMVGGSQAVNIDDGCGPSSVVHEVLHALGFLHEHQRSDRDDYINVFMSNLGSGWASSYTIVSGGLTLVRYDFNSIMHYPTYSSAGTSDNVPTLLKKNGGSIAYPTGMSSCDIDFTNATIPIMKTTRKRNYETSAGSHFFTIGIWTLCGIQPVCYFFAARIR